VASRSLGITPLDFFMWYTLRTFFTRLVISLYEMKLGIVAAAMELHRKCWRTLGGKLNTAWTSYVQRKALMLELFSILQY
jgi:hypothetical protein